jgi:hypothetical protein
MRATPTNHVIVAMGIGCSGIGEGDGQKELDLATISSSSGRQMVYTAAIF